jgi:hypothetical protein
LGELGRRGMGNEGIRDEEWWAGLIFQLLATNN